ncbi:MAG: DUF5597 domain-containing protein [Eubacteriales bacterium]|nr:DUF5597 domain-containing protein [Eubacteriales bacterium]
MIPEIRKLNGIDTLFVNDEPFFCLAGELHNSSASDLKYMEEHVWPLLQGLNMNSVIVPLYWELIEPEEGKYDFSPVQGLIEQARDNQMKLIFLWFGLWKNAESMYVPGWMKKDTQTYFRAEKVNGERMTTISPLCRAAVEKDKAAFRQVMRFIRSFDEKESTVIVMQVENEIGLLGTARDYCKAANDAFEAAVPEKLTEALQLPAGTWKEVFGKDAEESFMAYSFAKAVEEIAAAGREEYPLPCYANAWLRQYPWYPGSYPSGGPVVEMQPIWRATAPSLFTFGPDIYVSYVPSIMDEYHADNNPLFIPEVRKDAVTASYCLYAFGKHNAICYSPFGVEELNMDPDAIDKPPMEVMIALNIDPSAFDIAGSKEYVAAAYKLVEDMKPQYLQYRGTSHMQAYCKKSETDFGAFLEFEEFDLQVAYAPRIPFKPLGAGIVYELEPNKFLLCGMMSTFTFMPKAGENVKIDIVKLEEGHLEKGEWVSGRVLNGDEKMMLRLGDVPQCLMVEIYKY